ncbi:queuosine precursor transporter [Corynebacterium epidermidicanis]|uniref:queuosine precursor transporter n=1 Tax=Corynebacterium epidermidicanis TaxID=1050174 RepID=UPI001EEEB07E|nr:queuosine precursor transporter [Corynebacterium epidermidicanis]
MSTREIPVPRSHYPILLALFVTIFVVSNITAQKGVTLGPIITDGAFFLFPAAYIIGDVLTEVYGFRAMRRAIWTGFAAMLLAVLAFYVAIALPSAPFYEAQPAFQSILGLVPQIVLGSLVGYLVGQTLNSYVLVALKRRTGEKSLWARLLGSTIVGEFADTLLFCAIVASAIGISTWADFLNYVVVGFVWKTLVEVICMPVTYAVIAWVKRSEGY